MEVVEAYNWLLLFFCSDVVLVMSEYLHYNKVNLYETRGLVMINITLYASVENRRSLQAICKKAMGDYLVEEINEHLVIQKKGLFKKKIICEITQKNRLEEQESNQFTEGFVGYLSKELHGDEQLKQKLLYQAIHTNTIIDFQVVEKELQKLDFMAKILAATKEIGGLLFMPSGHILDAEGNEVVDGQGEITAEDVAIKVIEPQPNLTEFAQATVENQGVRRATIAKLEANHIPFTENMPLLPDTKSMKLHSVETIARRAAVVLIIIQFVREIVDEHEKASIKTSKRIAEVFLNRYGVKMNMTVLEEAFLQQENYEPQQLIDKMWLYESAWVMMWSIGLVDELKEPQEICDVEHVLNVLASYQNIGELLVDVTAREPQEILTRMDENYLYYWACVDARLKNNPTPADLDEGIVMERQRAFNWLTQLNNESWDDLKVKV